MSEPSKILIFFDPYGDMEGNGQKHLVTRGFSWCYAERLVSRARFVIEYINTQIDEFGPGIMDMKEVRKKVERMCDYNPDMEDVLMGSDLLGEAVRYGLRPEEVLGAPYPDGDLIISVKGPEIKYAFVLPAYGDGGCCDTVASTPPMDADAYMAGQRAGWPECPDGLDEEEILYTKENIRSINEHASLLTEEELEALRSWNMKGIFKKKREELANGLFFQIANWLPWTQSEEDEGSPVAVSYDSGNRRIMCRQQSYVPGVQALLDTVGLQDVKAVYQRMPGTRDPGAKPPTLR